MVPEIMWFCHVLPNNILQLFLNKKKNCQSYIIVKEINVNHKNY